MRSLTAIITPLVASALVPLQESVISTQFTSYHQGPHSVTAAAPAGQLGDGSAMAPAGTPQLPNLLNGYAVRPPWKVAGVDYAVGIPAGTVLKNPTTINMTGVSINGNVIYITGNNVTLDGYDFSLNGGYSVVVEGANDTVKDLNFAIGSSSQGSVGMTSTASNFTFEYNVMNGNGSTFGINQSELLNLGANSGQTTVEYNLIENAAQHAISIGNSSINNAGSFIIAYNVVEGVCDAPGAHGDLLQIEAGTFINAQVIFNTVYENNPPASTQGWMLEGNTGQTWIDSGTVAYNTTIALGATSAGGPDLGPFTGITPSTANPGTVSVNNNYFDPTSMTTLVRDRSVPRLSICANNRNMITGAVMMAC